ncbi:MAG: hypothetical protein SH868_03885 [Bythopirellula sp.]|nr:hypothetical protein [Bythopirellula sp.]
MSKIVGKNSLIGILIVVLFLAAAWLLMQHHFVQTMLGITSEDYVISNVHVGDTEKRLVELLLENNVEYGISDQGGHTLYSLSHGLAGVCFFYVADGKVEGVVFD